MAIDKEELLYALLKMRPFDSFLRTSLFADMKDVQAVESGFKERGIELIKTSDKAKTDAFIQQIEQMCRYSSHEVNYLIDVTNLVNALSSLD